MFDKEEFERWTAQASDTLNSARQDYSAKSYNWCNFCITNGKKHEWSN